MKFTELKRALALLIAGIVLVLSGCGGEAKNAANKANDKTDVSNAQTTGNPWDATDYNEDEIVDKNGNYIIEKLTKTNVSELKKVGNKQVIYYKGKPYLLHATHFRYDHLLSAKLDDKTLKSTFDEGMRLVKEAGFDTVILYLNWNRLYDGKNYDLTELAYQYSVAKKYDLKIIWNWFGYDVCGYGGYRSWQKNDLKKYPPLKDENGNIMYGTGYAEGKMIPDLSAQAFIDDEIEMLNQLCAWLNVNDTDRRTVAIQVENEINHTEGGHGLWFSQYSNVINLIDKLTRAIKDGPYSMITYVNLMAAGWNDIVEGKNFEQQVKGLIDLECLDIVGWDDYTTTINPDCEVIKQGDNPSLMVEFGGCIWAAPAQTNVLLSKGFGIGYYHFLEYNETPNTITAGIYKFGGKNNPFVLRDGSGMNGYYNGAPEVVATEFFAMNKSINALSEIIAVSSEQNMIYFNNSMKVKRTENKGVSGSFFIFNTDSGNDKYGSTALLIKEDKNTFYTYASKTATIKYKNGNITSASEGVYKDGKWVKTKDVEIIDGAITYEPGKAYQIIVE